MKFYKSTCRAFIFLCLFCILGMQTKTWAAFDYSATALTKVKTYYTGTGLKIGLFTGKYVNDINYTYDSFLNQSPYYRYIQTGVVYGISNNGGTGYNPKIGDLNYGQPITAIYQVIAYDEIAAPNHPGISNKKALLLSQNISNAADKQVFTVEGFRDYPTFMVYIYLAQPYAVSQLPVTISPTTQTVTVGASVTFTAAGGSGTGAYTWGASATGTGVTNTVTFNTVGAQTVSVYRAASTGYTVSNTAVANITVVAPVTYSLGVTANPSNGGTVSGAGSYNANTAVSIGAVPASGWYFTGWTSQAGFSIANASSSSTTGVLTANSSAVANFARSSVALTVTSVGPGVTSPSGVSSYSVGDIATVTATPNAGARFVTWAGDSTSTNASINVTMNSDKAVSALFQAKSPQTITFVLQPLKIRAAVYPLTATATSGLPVTLTKLSGEVTLTGTPETGYTLFVYGPGVVTLTATQAGDTFWLPADPVTQTVTVDAQKLTVTSESSSLKILQGNEGEVPEFGKK